MISPGHITIFRITPKKKFERAIEKVRLSLLLHWLVSTIRKTRC